MNEKWPRRSWISSVGAAAAALSLGSKPVAAQARGPFTPTRHPQDEWFDQVGGKHRTFIDSSTPNGGGAAILYANNLFVANKSGYGLDDPDLAIVVCLRHFSTVFAFTDAIWGKYGKALSDVVQFVDPKTQQAPSTNLYNSTAYGMSLPNGGITIDSIGKRGVQFAVCDMATHMITGAVAGAVKGNADALYKEFVANLVPNSHLVAAGVVAVNRAQEHGYTLLSAG